MGKEFVMGNPIGHITIVHGTATAAAGDTVRPLKVGDSVFEDDLVVTKTDSAVEIRFADDTVLAQGANSELLLDEYTYDPTSGDGNLAFDMVQGTFRSVTGAIVDTNPENFELGSPLATIGIRGTVTAHTIPPSWAADATEDHVVLVFDGKPVLVIFTADGDIRLIDTAGRKVEVSELGASQVTIMTVAEYLYYEQLAHQQLTNQEPAWDSPEEILQQYPDTNRPVGDNPAENLGDLNPADYRSGDLDGDGDVDADDAQIAQDKAEELVKAVESMVLEGNGTESMLQSTRFLLGGNQFLLQGSSFAMGTLQSLLNQASGFGQPATLLTTATTVESVVSSIASVSFTSTSPTLTAAQISSGFVASAPTINGTFTISLPPGAAPPAGTSVSADFSSFSTSQAVIFNASSITTGGYFTATGGSASDQISGTNHNVDGDTINGGDGNDTLYGFYGDDTINGGAGVDQIYGNQGSTTPVGTGSDNDTINGGEGNDILQGDEGDDVIHGDAGDDTIRGSTGNDTLYGDGDQDTINGNDGNDTLFGGDDNDTLHGDAGDDSLTGEAGADALFGEAGDDTFIYNGTADVGSGEVINGGSNTDTIRVDSNTDFSALNSANVTNTEQLSITAGVTATFHQNQGAMIGSLASISGANNTLSTVESIVFSLDVGGTLNLNTGLNPAVFSNWGTEDIVRINGNTGNETITGNTMDETFYGGGGSDTITPGAGNDKIYGEAQNDTFDFSASAANFTDLDIVDGGNHYDTIKINAAAATTYTLANVNQVEVIEISSTANAARFVLAGTLNGYEGVASYDASAMGTSSDLHLDTSAETNPTGITAGAGSNTLISGNASDTFDFGSTTFNGSDSADGGAGTDEVKVAYATTTFANLNSLVNIENVTITGTGAGFSWTLDATMAGFVTTIDFSAATIGGGGTFIVDASVATSDMTIKCGSSEGSDVTFGSGVDTVTGSAGPDSFIFGTRYTNGDSVNGGAHTSDVLSFTASTTEAYTFSQVSAVETILLGAAATNINLGASLNGSSAATAVIIDGSGMGSNVLTFDSGSNSSKITIKGGDAGDSFAIGSDINDVVIEGNAGNDTVTYDGTTISSGFKFVGGAGTDTVHIQGTVDFQTNAISAQFSASGANKIEKITFADGATATFKHDAPASLNNFDSITGGSGSTTETLNIVTDTAGTDFSAFNPNLTTWGTEDVIKYTGTADANTITGSNSTLNETMYGGAGNDTFNLNGGNNKLYGEGGEDTFTFGANYTDSDVVDGGSGNSDTLTFTPNAGAYTLANVSNVEFITMNTAMESEINLAGSITAVGATNATINAGSISDSFDFNGSNALVGVKILASGGIDHFTGTGGDDVFDFSSKYFGATETVHGGNGDDELIIKIQGTSPSATALNATTSIETFTLNSFVPNFSWTLNNAVFDDSASGTVTFSTNANGTETNYFNGSAESGASLTINGSGLDDTLYGGGGNDTINGGGNGDALYGNDGNDVINGGASSDSITGGSGNDTLTGGVGNDTIYSGSGSDIIKYYNTNESGDTLKDFATGTDKLQFATGPFAADATLVHGSYGGVYIPTMATSNQYFVFDDDTGKLWYDPDGNGATATETLMATLHDGANALALDMDGTLAAGNVDIEVV